MEVKDSEGSGRDKGKREDKESCERVRWCA